MLITLKDGSQKEYQNGLSVYEIAKDLSEGLARVALGAKVNGQVVETSYVINEDATLEILTFKDDEGKRMYRHTCSHILAQAIKNIYPTSKLAIGPAIDDGFYYDIDFKTPITTDDLEKIELEMKCVCLYSSISSRMSSIFDPASFN